MSTGTAHEQTNAAGALLALITAHAHLPAKGVELCRFVGATSPDLVWGIRLTVHDDLSHFEQWRDALGIDPATIEQGRSGTTLGWLTAFGTYSGVMVELVVFYNLDEWP